MVGVPRHGCRSAAIAAIHDADDQRSTIRRRLARRAYLGVLGGNAVFGILGAALVILLWFYLLSLAFMVGAEVTRC